MAAPPVKSPLHNFPLPYLKWGSKKDSRCRRTPPHETPLSPPLDPTSTTAAVATAVEHSNPVGSRSSRNRRINLHLTSDTPPNDDDDDVAKKEKHPENDGGGGVGGGGGGGDEKGWNLRPRRAVTIKTTSNTNTNTNTNTVVESGGNGGDGMVKSMRLRGVETLGGGGACGGSSGGGGGGGGGERREKRKFWIALSRDEIEEDIYSMTASKPSRRPKKRPKNVQKQLDNVFPGLWLVGISPEAYRGLDVPPKR